MNRLSSMLTWRSAKRLVIAVIGGTVALFGVLLLAFPGPGIPVLILGLAILATEFIWAQVLLKKVKQKAGEAIQKARNGFRGNGANKANPPQPQEPPAQEQPCKPADSVQGDEPRGD